MPEPLVSILIPFKNVENYFEECLISIHNQTYTHWEVIAVNDHSNDASLEIAMKFSEQDERFQILTNQGSGIISALRLGYEKSNGEYITRMDADDYMALHRLKIMIGSLLKKGKGFLALGKVRYFAHGGVNEGYRKYEQWLNGLTANGENYTEIYKECVVPSPCWMVHTSDLERCGAFEPDRYPEDYDLTFRFYEKELTCIPCNEVLHYWRDYNTRTSRTSEHYAENYFLDLKLYYFLRLDYKQSKTLVIWGAGKKGKEIAKSLIALEMSFEWVCNNPKKIGKDIYGTTLKHYDILTAKQNKQYIITVANEKEQQFIKSYFNTINHNEALEYFFFC